MLLVNIYMNYLRLGPFQNININDILSQVLSKTQPLCFEINQNMHSNNMDLKLFILMGNVKKNVYSFSK